jgi:hypothetical protein
MVDASRKKALAAICMARAAPLLLGCLFLAGCTTALPPTAGRVIPSGPPLERVDYGFERAAVESDLLTTARAYFGEAAVRRALAAEVYLLAKYYHGRMPPPPPPGTPWSAPKPPMGMLVKEGGRWFAATPTEFRPAQLEAVAGIEAILANRSF